jgi:hypothetical protein
MWLRLASGVWLGGDAGHSGQRKTVLEYGAAAERFAKSAVAMQRPAEPVVLGIYVRKHNFDQMSGVVVERQYWNQQGNRIFMPQDYIDNYE